LPQAGIVHNNLSRVDILAVFTRRASVAGHRKFFLANSGKASKVLVFLTAVAAASQLSPAKPS
jgi:hypothetical protein